MYISRKIYGWSVLLVALMTTCAGRGEEAADNAYVDVEQGRSTWMATFDRKMETPAEQWVYAKKTRDKGRLRKADRRMLYLFRRWPNSKEAPWAARARADMLFERGKWKDASESYQFLIDNYSSRMRDYDTVLENQFTIAEKIMNRRRMRWLFGGYRSPQFAVEYFEAIIRNGPQWSRAAEAQFMIGKCNQEDKEFELAISAYSMLGYRYPDSSYAEEGAWQMLNCLGELRKEYPSSPEILDRILTASTVFLSTYPGSQYHDKIVDLRNELYEIKAGKAFDEAAFYARVPKEPQAAIICYEKMMEEYPKSIRVPQAEERIAKLKKLMAMPVKARTADAPRSRPLPFTKEATHAEG